MAINDTVKIAVIVASPVLFFSLLFLSAYIYRRRRSSGRKGTFRQPEISSPPQNQEKGVVWDPSERERTLPHCHICYVDHRPCGTSRADSQKTLVNNGICDQSRPPLISVLPDCNSTLSQPHFQEKRITIRRLSSNPYLPDEYTKVNSLSSTLGEANPSSDILPYGGGRRSSYVSMTQSFLPGDPEIGCKSLAQENHESDSRRLTAFSGGLAEKDRLSVRRVSVGGHEDVLNLKVKALNTNTAVPPAHSCYFTQHRRSTSTQPPPLPTLDPSSTSTNEAEDLPSPHPFSAASLRRSSFVSHPPMQFPVPHIRRPERASANSSNRQRPETLQIASQHPNSLSPVSIGTSGQSMEHRRRNSLIVPTASPNQAMKSASTSIGSHIPDTASSFGHDPIPPKAQDLNTFHSWQGFRPSEHANVIPRIELPISPTTPSEGRRGTPSAAFAQLNSNNSSSTTLQVTTPNSGLERSPSSCSKITYLAEVVKEEEKRISSIRSSPDNMYPPGDRIVGSRKSMIDSQAPALSPLRLERGLGIHSALGAGMGIGMAVGLGAGEVEVDDGQPRAI
ncbi:uncharacterized protein IL334_007138 [Kwoniella shivajii]|uniref:Uncharacterized protein n=1 Tax=Kwoniella shivajii TaxID=564305 RepID=A0ABZ1DA39_9TREE|nr:hypothetical protein IL334_007138 [Kwoniella shivajii]